jgi:hypothetical protein
VWAREEEGASENDAQIPPPVFWHTKDGGKPGREKRRAEGRRRARDGHKRMGAPPLWLHCHLSKYYILFVVFN